MYYCFLFEDKVLNKAIYFKCRCTVKSVQQVCSNGVHILHAGWHLLLGNNILCLSHPFACRHSIDSVICPQSHSSQA